MQPPILNFEAYDGEGDPDFVKIARLKLTRNELYVDVVATHGEWKTMDGENGYNLWKWISTMVDVQRSHLHALCRFHQDDCWSC